MAGGNIFFLFLLLLLLALAACLELGSLAQDKVLTLGYLTGSQRRPGDQEYPRPGLTISGAISLAVEEVNSQGLVLGGQYTLDFLVAETYGDETESILQTAILWKKNVTAYIGPQETCVHEARLAASFNLPMISYYCPHFEASDKRRFFTFARTRPPDLQISKSVASVLLTFSWTTVAFLFPSSADAEFEKITETIANTLTEAGVHIKFRHQWSTPYHHGYMENPFLKIVRETSGGIRIYVILGQYYEHLGLMLALEENNLLENGEYFVVGVDVEQYDEEAPEKYLRGLLQSEPDFLAPRAFRSYVGVVGSSPKEFDNFTRLVNEYMEKPPFNFPNPLTRLGGIKRIRAEAAYLYDAVHLYAKALSAVLSEGGDPYNGTAVIDAIKGKIYHSAMGYMVAIDSNGDAEGNYTLIALQQHGDMQDGGFGLYPVGVFHPATNLQGIPELHFLSPIHWVNGKMPVAEPACGFSGEKCISRTGEIAGGFAGSVVLTLVLVSLVLYRNWRYEQELDSLLWKIDYKEIQINENTPTNTSSKISRALHPLMRSSQVSLSSNPDTDFRYSTIYTQLGVYKGRIFAIKKVCRKSLDITRQMKKELKMMRDLRHDNLNSFIGACVESPNICIITEYCARGSLKDILENEDVKLDNMFIASLVGDIVRGMIYLHESPVRSHGNLKTSNCLVDSRWVVKISDFGLHELNKGADIEPSPCKNTDPQKNCENLLYRAPELLRDLSASSSYGTQKGDVYSFAIVLYEIHNRHGPYGEIGMNPTDILKRLLHPAVAGQPFRPQLELLENCFDCVRECLKECWAEVPEDRPDFKSIRTKLRPMRKGMKANIFDNMIAMMEKYANNLEALVDERTDQLIEEKRKTEALLYEMLPRYVAEQLKRGNKVEAESFDCVTIYFSDIVGFTTMSAESTPLQVVDFLNDLYTYFDSIIENYDVYKVETIGDAYMVVSGLPVRNGDQHAGEIATMSLHLLEATKRFHIRHRPNDTLKLRIGIHSGPVCAGVVGLKMPRYCLFGDTVNTASRMESTGVPLRIHCSEACKNLLSKLGGYILENRGLVRVKGKGEMVTCWLMGEDAVQRTQRAEERRQRLRKLSACREADGRRGRYSLRGPVSRTLSLESPKKLRFAADALIALGSPSTEGGSIGVSPLSDVTESPATSKSPQLAHQKRNSCPCINDLQTLREFTRRHVKSASANDLWSPTRLSSHLCFDLARAAGHRKPELVDHSLLVDIPENNSSKADGAQVDKETTV